MASLTGTTRPRGDSEVGAVAVFVALSMIVLLGVAALALDLGHLYVVHGELQNAAEAGALAGASELCPRTGPPRYTLRWDLAAAAATEGASANRADRSEVSPDSPLTGFWNLTRTPPGLQPEGIEPGAHDVPAVQVTVRDPVANWFASVFGANTSDVAAVATAVCPATGTVESSRLFPAAIPEWDVDDIRAMDTVIYTGPMYDRWLVLDQAEFSVGDQVLLTSVPPNLAAYRGVWILPVVDRDESELLGFVGFRIDLAYEDPPGTLIVLGGAVEAIFEGRGEPVGRNFGVYAPMPRLSQ